MGGAGIEPAPAATVRESSPTLVKDFGIAAVFEAAASRPLSEFHLLLRNSLRILSPLSSLLRLRQANLPALMHGARETLSPHALFLWILLSRRLSCRRFGNASRRDRRPWIRRRLRPRRSSFRLSKSPRFTIFGRASLWNALQRYRLFSNRGNFLKEIF